MHVTKNLKYFSLNLLELDIFFFLVKIRFGCPKAPIGFAAKRKSQVTISKLECLIPTTE